MKTIQKTITPKLIESKMETAIENIKERITRNATHGMRSVIQIELAFKLIEEELRKIEEWK